MPASSGPNTAGEENLVFAYDVEDTRNSYKGEPTTNLFSNPKFTNHTDVTVGTTSVIKRDFGDGKIGIEMIQAGTSDIASFSMGSYSAPTSGGTYTWSSFIHSTSTGGKVKAQVTVYVNGTRHWLTNSNTWVTSTTECSHLFIATVANQWHRIDNQFTLPTGTLTNLQLGSFYRTTSNFTIKLANAQLELKPHATPFTTSTRSATQGLLELTGNSVIDVSNVSFDNNAQMVFDGTNDYVNMGDLPIIKLGTNFTIEAVVKPEQDKWMYFFHKGYGQNNSLAWGRHSSGDNWFFSTMINGSYQNSYMGTATLNQYCHLAASYDGANLRLYENGDLQATVAITHDMMTNTQPLGIGGPDRYWNGEIPVTKVYNKALTAQEVKQNYQQYKTRFNLS